MTGSSQNHSQKQPLLRVELLGFHRRTANTLVLALNGPAKGFCTLADSAEAEASIIDMDTEEGQSIHDQRRTQYPGRPILLVSSNLTQLPNDSLLLWKPIKLAQLTDALKTLSRLARTDHHTNFPTPANALELKNSVERQIISRPYNAEHERTATTDLNDRLLTKKRSTLHNRNKKNLTELSQKSKLSCGSSQDVDLYDGAQVGGLLYSIKGSVLDLLTQGLEKARAERKSQQILLNGKKFLALDYAGKSIVGINDEPAMVIYCRRRFQDGVLSLQQLADDAVDLWQPEFNGTALRHSTESWLWKIALWTYRGKLPESTDLSMRVYLRYWPNFTRLQEIPQAMKIATLWSKQRVTLGFTAATLKIPQRYVFAFYSAAYTIGLSGQARREADYLFAQSPVLKMAEKPSFLEQLMRKLKRRKT